MIGAVAMALAGTGAALALLGRTDPKRRRVLGRPANEGPVLRRLAVAAAVIPGAVLLGTGQGAAFLIWLGGATVAGWAVALLLPARPV